MSSHPSSQPGFPPRHTGSAPISQTPDHNRAPNLIGQPPPPPHSQHPSPSAEPARQHPHDYAPPPPRIYVHSGPQQIVHTQLTPSVGSYEIPVPSVSTTPVPVLQQQRQASPGSSFLNLPASLQRGLFQPQPSHDAARNVGFTPSAKLAAQHANAAAAAANAGGALSAEHHPKHQFHVTKLRSWRTGYCRILVLYEDCFATVDPASGNEDGKGRGRETNRWPYSSLVEWMALPNEEDALLLQIDKEKLKLSTSAHSSGSSGGSGGGDSRALVLSLLLQCADEAGQLRAQERVVFRNVQRQTRHDGAVVDVALHVEPYGLVEFRGGGGSHHQERLQTYRYVDMTSCSLTPNGLIIYFHQPFQTRSYIVPTSYRPNGNGRSDLLTLMREQCEILGIPLEMQESVSDWLGLRRQTLTPQTVGAVASSWTVTKSSRRRSGQSATRTLIITGLGLLVERDDVGIVSARRLSELYALVRHSDSNAFTIEYSNRSSRTFTSTHRDALLVSLLDAATTLAKNTAIHVVDVSTFGYCLSGMSRAMPSDESSGGLFRPISIPQYCLKRVYAHATSTYAFMAPSEFSESQSSRSPAASLGLAPVPVSSVVNECVGLVEVCREFNASVLPGGEGLPTGPTDKLVLGSVGALWGLVACLLRENASALSSSGQGAIDASRHESRQVEAQCCTFLQTLYRLSKTCAGYKGSVDLTTLKEALPLIWKVDDPFCKFWILQVFNSLVSGLPLKRDLESEFVNKSVVMSGPGVVDGLVTTLVAPSVLQSPDGRATVSDLVLMAASDLLQGILCSYYETTKPETFSAVVNSLAQRCVRL
jgi:DNAJ protein RME-8 N-terminal